MFYRMITSRCQSSNQVWLVYVLLKINPLITSRIFYIFIKIHLIIYIIKQNMINCYVIKIHPGNPQTRVSYCWSSSVRCRLVSKPTMEKIKTGWFYTWHLVNYFIYISIHIFGGHTCNYIVIQLCFEGRHE